MRKSLLIILLCMSSVVLAFGDRSVRDDRWTDKYDNLFRKYTKHYFGPHIDWHWFKAQAIVESSLKSKVKSNKGAVGLMQILPSTYDEIRDDLPYLADITQPRWNIAAGIFYDRKLYRRWKDKGEFQTQDLPALTFGSYNAGFGRMLRAVSRAKRKNDKVARWEQVEPYAPKQTRDYVQRIHQLMADAETIKR